MHLGLGSQILPIQPLFSLIFHSIAKKVNFIQFKQEVNMIIGTCVNIKNSTKQDNGYMSNVVCNGNVTNNF